MSDSDRLDEHQQLIDSHERLLAQLRSDPLLSDIRTVWGCKTCATSKTPLISHVLDVAHVLDMPGVRSTDSLLADLRALDESPWGDWYGKPLTARGLAKLLRPYEVRSTQVRIDDKTPRGYQLADFADAWKRYL